jgi:ABC-type lipoprotein export system ATPase subunit
VVMDIFENLQAQGRTIFMVTHDLELAKRGSRIVTLSDGEVISETGQEAAHA